MLGSMEIVREAQWEELSLAKLTERDGRAMQGTSLDFWVHVSTLWPLGLPPTRAPHRCAFGCVGSFRIDGEFQNVYQGHQFPQKTKNWPPLQQTRHDRSKICGVDSTDLAQASEYAGRGACDTLRTMKQGV